MTETTTTHTTTETPIETATAALVDVAVTAAEAKTVAENNAEEIGEIEESLEETEEWQRQTTTRLATLETTQMDMMEKISSLMAVTETAVQSIRQVESKLADAIAKTVIVNDAPPSAEAPENLIQETARESQAAAKKLEWL